MKKAPKAPETTEAKFDYRTIKTFEDACKKIRVTTALPTLVNGCQELMKSTIAAYKLMVIFQAINDGWVPNWDDSDQYKYYPYFRVLSSGSGFSHSHFSYVGTFAHVGSRLCTNSSEKSYYIAEQFEQEYKDLFLYN